MKWSNATPIRCHTDKGYACCFCDQQFLDPADLKDHTTQIHRGNTAITKKSDLTGYHVKLDITGLRCACAEYFDTLEAFIEHLLTEHKVKYYTRIKNHIVPFKFDTEELRCYICSNKFCTFKMLLCHMNIHIRNYVCTICDAGFVYVKQLKNHSGIHKTGSFKCGHCEKSFTTLQKCRYHTDYVHKPRCANKCGFCGESFRLHSQKKTHQRKEHGILSENRCTACDRSFSTQRNYRIHMQRDHLMERRHGCKQCDMRFYTTSQLKDHMVKHNIGLRVFQCDVCLKSYGRKTTLKEHLRIHADDRRYKCDLCGQAFVQKCSWRGHMSSKHGIVQPKV
ncbi:unnamed protein product [Leptosia nina]|uniref:C2H2-type domain-containing protein n=1 Tax=Leptosia nina TaxID=320188 RepID=A0AAV1JXT6_9NEOP